MKFFKELLEGMLIGFLIMGIGVTIFMKVLIPYINWLLS